jgi:hypothetical protein
VAAIEEDEMSVTRDFDQERREKPVKTFQLAGETFTLRRSVRPEALIQFEDLPEDATARQSLQVIDDAVNELIVPDDHTKWSEIRAIEDEESAVGLDTLLELIKWCIGQVTGRNPTQPSSSTSPPGDPGTTSTDGSQPEELTSGRLISVGS